MSGTIQVNERVWASLPYLLPLSASVFFGDFIFQQLWPIAYLYLPAIWLYRNVLMFPVVPLLGIGGEFVVFLLLYLLVIRDRRVSRFIRFNAMQALLLEIVLFLAQLVVRLLAEGLGGLAGMSFVVETVANIAFLGMALACGYAVYHCIVGTYSDLPGISEAAAIQCEL